MSATYDPADWYWRAADGRLFGSKARALLPEEDPGFAAWSASGGIPTAWPRDEADAQTQAALDTVLRAAGLTAGVPASVSSAQAKIALKRAGFLPAVRAIIDALGDDEVEIWFTDARVWERTNPHVLAVAQALDLSEAEVDGLFATARLIAA